MTPSTRCALGLAGALAILAPGLPALAANADWSGLDWLAGRWTGAGGGADAGGFSFEREAGGAVLMRRNFAVYAAHDGKPAERHDDLMVIWP
ncbi:MAG TPA: hypothetical protein VG248_14260, partial [Caulobacteraceae bacterium]|nr:hypothetical protein [Caulobacteraceae bacterium]